jgi:tRNA A37 N6-isopentenylltransferase MiaA
MSKPRPTLPAIERPDGGLPGSPQELGKSGFEESDLYQLWERRVKKSDNDLIIAIAASSRSPISGTGKTTLAIRLAREFDATGGGFDGEEKASLDSEVVAEELIPELEPKSSIIFDEAQGTLASDGVDSRRGMANAVVRMARAAAQYRKRQHTLIIVAQSTDWIDSRMMDLIDRLVLIQQRGYAKVYDHYRDDLPSASASNEYTPVKERIRWHSLSSDDGDYEALDNLKEQANDKETEEQAVDKSRQIAKAATAYHEQDLTWREIEQKSWAEFSREWYRTEVNELAREA